MKENLECRACEDAARPTAAHRELEKETGERQVVEESSRDSEARYRLLFESNPVPMWVYDRETLSFLAVNEAATHRYGYARAEFLSMTIKDIRPPEDVPALLENIPKTATGISESGAWRHQKKDRTIIDVEITSYPLIFDGRRAGLVLAHDITERKRMEAERQVIFEIIQGVITTSNLEELLKLIHHSISKLLSAENCFVALHDETSNLMRFEFWVDKFDPVPPARPIGKGFSSHVLRTGQPLLLTAELKAQMYERGEVQKSGTDSASWLGVPLRTPSRTIGVLVVQHYEDQGAYGERDVEFLTSVGSQIALAIERKRAETELQKSEEQLRQAQKMEAVGKLAGGVAHDFNNLLTAINGYSDLSLRRLDQADPLYRNLNEIKKAGVRAAALTRQLLAFSRKQILQPKVLDLNQVVVETNNMLQRLIGEDIDLLIGLAPDLGKVKADPNQIEQVLMNLAVNARDAMPRGGKLTIETDSVYLDERYAGQHLSVRPGRYIMLAVSDTGCGMDAPTRERIFEPFFTTKGVGQGTGLGLATVYGIVKQSEGSIWVYSEVGRGTTFKIYLPRVAQSKEDLKTSADEARLQKGTETVLLVEDEELVRNMTREILEESGYQVLEAKHGAAALILAQQHHGPIHLMLSDVVMPVMSGRELAEQLATLRSEMKVLYMSGYTDDAIVHHGVLDEGMAFIEKPFTPHALARKVREILSA